MSKSFYSENEEMNFDESLNKYEFLFKDIELKPPTLEEALIELFRNGGLSEKDSKEIYNHLYKVCNNRVNEKWDEIRKQNPKISKSDALIISSYTYEPKAMYEKFSPYRLLNTNLVSVDRKNGIINVEKYFFLLLVALRGLIKTKKNVLFRCISCKVKLVKDPNNDHWVNGNKKFTITVSDGNAGLDKLEFKEGDGAWQSLATDINTVVNDANGSSLDNFLNINNAKPTIPSIENNEFGNKSKFLTPAEAIVKTSEQNDIPDRKIEDYFKSNKNTI